jgi:hypothetical protein
VRQVGEQFALIAELDRVRLPGQPVATSQEQAMARAGTLWARDQTGAIAAFQTASGEATLEERRDTVVLPTGRTWRALFTFASYARELDALRDRATGAQDNIHTGTFDHAAFRTLVAAGFAADRVADARFNSGSLTDWDRMLGYLERDPRMIDIRWMAYVFATAYWEGAHTVSVGQRPNGRPIMAWRTVVPIEEGEHGAGRRYHLPVKVERISATEARVTEQDGDQFSVTPTGTTVIRRTTTGEARGSPATLPPSRVYQQAAGTELSYFGRGYVQLTWFANYAAAGVSIGRSLALLYNPQLALQPDVAYALMAHSMLTGDGFANRRTLGEFIYGSRCDYAGARALVNANDPQPAIVSSARIFETALRSARR